MVLRIKCLFLQALLWFDGIYVHGSASREGSTTLHGKKSTLSVKGKQSHQSLVTQHGNNDIDRQKEVDFLSTYGRGYKIASEMGDKTSMEGEDGCPMISLGHASLWLHPNEDEVTERSGSWKTNDGGTLVTYTQEMFSYSYETLYFHLDHNLFFSIRPRNNFDRVFISKNTTGLVIENCNSETIFNLAELSASEEFSYEIYDRNGKLLGYSKKGDLFPDQLQFFDPQGNPLAISESPEIVKSAEYSTVANNDHPGRVPTYETEFIISDKSFLGKPENRWIIMAAVTVRALRNAKRAADGKIVVPAAFYWYQFMIVIFFIIGLVVFCNSMSYLYHRAFPSREYQDLKGINRPNDDSDYGTIDHTTRNQPYSA